jgi:hypothetical protein
MYCNTKFTRFLGSKNLLELKNIGFGYLVFILEFSLFDFQDWNIFGIWFNKFDFVSFVFNVF